MSIVRADNAAAISILSNMTAFISKSLISCLMTFMLHNFSVLKNRALDGSLISYDSLLSRSTKMFMSFRSSAGERFPHNCVIVICFLLTSSEFSHAKKFLKFFTYAPGSGSIQLNTSEKSRLARFTSKKRVRSHGSSSKNLWNHSFVIGAMSRLAIRRMDSMSYV